MPAHLPKDHAVAELDALRGLSAKVGGDPLLVQAAGGNTSVKSDDRLWIKASGTWLARALEDEIMVPVRLSPLVKAVASGDVAAEAAHGFVEHSLNPSGLRPSIETAVHAIIPRTVVVHVHCVETISVAVRQDAETVLRERLQGLNWVFVPYARPGLRLAKAVRERIRQDTDIVVLGNHGLVVAAETVGEAEALLDRVRTLLADRPRTAPAPDREALVRLARGSDYRLPEEDAIHDVAGDLVSCGIAAGGSLYPDHVVFLGPGSTVAGAGESAADVARAAMRRGEPAPIAILFPGKGVLVHGTASPGAEAMALCLSHVTARIGEQAPLNYLSEEDVVDLLDWDAEKYRQRLNDSREAAGQ